MPPIVIEVREAMERAELQGTAGKSEPSNLCQKVPQYTSNAGSNSTKICGYGRTNMTVAGSRKEFAGDLSLGSLAGSGRLARGFSPLVKIFVTTPRIRVGRAAAGNGI